MRKILAFALFFSLLAPATASAHQPVALEKGDSTAVKGPLLVDGTVSFAVRAAFTRAGESRGFRLQLKANDQLSVQYLIVDKAPENKLKKNQLPVVVLRSPSGKSATLKITERSKFYEPYSGTNYLYLSRYSAVAESGIYSVTITSRQKSSITIAVGDREVEGEVIRGEGKSPSPAPTPVASPTPTAIASASPTPTPTQTPTATTSQRSYSAKDLAINNSANSCWSAIDGKVYDLTQWISLHPGGPSAIKFLCGVDGSKAFASQHRGQPNPTSKLAQYLLGDFTN